MNTNHEKTGFVARRVPRRRRVVGLVTTLFALLTLVSPMAAEAAWSC